MYVNSMQVDDIKICPKRNPHTVLVNAKASIGMPGFLSGIVKLDHRLENIVAFKVDLFNLSDRGSDSPLQNGYIRLLKSAYLGGLCVDNLFKVAASTDAPQNTLAISMTDVIAWTFPSDFGNVASFTDPYFPNSIRKFSRPRDIEGFDWKIESINTTLTSIAPFACEMVIVFYEACQC